MSSFSMLFIISAGDRHICTAKNCCLVGNLCLDCWKCGNCAKNEGVWDVLKDFCQYWSQFVVNNRKKVLGREEISLDDVYEHNFPILTWMSKFRRKSCTLWTCARILKVRCFIPLFFVQKFNFRENFRWTDFDFKAQFDRIFLS